MDTPVSKIIARIRPMLRGLNAREQQDLIEAIMALFHETETDDPLAREQAAWFARPREERKPFQGECVAVHDGRVIDHDPDQREPYVRVRRQYGAAPVLIVHADWDRPPEFVFRRFSLEQATIP